MNAEKVFSSDAIRITMLPPASIEGDRGGMRLVANAAGGLTVHGFNVEVITSEISPYIGQNSSIRVTISAATRARNLLVPLMRHFRRSKPHIIMPYGAETMLITAIAKAASLSRVLILPVFPDAADVWSTSSKDRVIGFLARSLMKHVKVAVAGSDEASAELVRFWGIPDDRVYVVYNPVIDLDQFEQQADEPLDHAWFAGGGPPVIIGAGQLIERKGFLTLIRAFSLLRNTCQARLMIIGKGPQRAQLEEMIRESGLNGEVRLAGFVKNPYPYFKKSSVFVNPSVREGFPNTLVEALAAGTQVISTDCRCGHRELLVGGNFQRIVPRNDPQRLAEALLRVLAAEPDPGKLKAHARAFSLSRAARGYTEAVERAYPHTHHRLIQKHGTRK